MNRGDIVKIVCQGKGGTIPAGTGVDGDPNLWDRLDDGTWVADFFVGTNKPYGTNPNADPWRDPALPDCQAVPTSVGRVQQLVNQWMQLEIQCRGNTGLAAEDACDQRHEVRVTLESLGWCYGKKSDRSLAEALWHPCGPDSYRQN